MVDQLQQKLTAALLELEALKSATEPSSCSAPVVLDDESPDLFDNLDDENDTEHTTDSHTTDNDHHPPENRTLVLPSTHMPNADGLRKAELNLRIRQASRNLTAI